MLRIKEEKWVEFQEKSEEYGFRMNEYGNGYSRSFHGEEEHPNDTFELLISTGDKQITIETSNSRYSGFSTDGSELVVVYDLIANGFVEKVVS